MEGEELAALDVQPDDGQGEARLGGLGYARLCRPSASIRDKSDTVSFSKNAVLKELGENTRAALRRRPLVSSPLVKKVGAGKSRRCLRLFALRSKASSAHLKENYALLKKLSEM